MAVHQCSPVRVFVRWFLAFLVLVSKPLPSRSLPSTKNRRTSVKANDRFVRWTNNGREKDPEKSRLIWVDGNNVRGIGKFEWSAVELQQRVARFCHMHKIQNAIVVWDHGSDQSAFSTRYLFYNDSFGMKYPVKNDQMDNHDSNIFCVNLVTLFSGIRQRADDVIVKESKHLVSSSLSLQDDSKWNAKIDWASMAFVTNDRDLNYKLRQQSTPNHTSIRLGRRKRRDNDKIQNFDDIDTIGTTSKQMTRKDVEKPLFCDSTGFVDLLSELPNDCIIEMSDTDRKASESIEAAKSAIRRCARSQRRGYNPRREKTWERCVQAEAFRRFLLGTSHVGREQPSEAETPSKQLQDENSVFAANYLQELHIARGYSIKVREKNNDCKGDNTNTVMNEFLPFLGPSRLDKHQRRLLDRYNALVRSGEIA